ncbi:hypothetical protein GCK72_015485 [Caenorhabditis remanei]|uniref:Uncharacterized protein n=1 Tax=Caenorhabditis remanei TaxID=31234 RepID=A0A6A5GWZ2_CAERE|nr:hypothetical protein GCK72_015485 [Caenorhabditis remanei]KAF1759025.1 hypothetical protein GCK72_015485 [Caenorhabditis remanei]
MDDTMDLAIERPMDLANHEQEQQLRIVDEQVEYDHLVVLQERQRRCSDLKQDQQFRSVVEQEDFFFPFLTKHQQEQQYAKTKNTTIATNTAPPIMQFQKNLVRSQCRAESMKIFASTLI